MENVKNIFNQLLEKMAIDEKIGLKLVPMKCKIASFSFYTKTVRLNKKMVKILNEEELKYILLHELIHFKIKDVNHGPSFQNELKKYYSRERIKNLEEKISEKVLTYYLLI